MPANAESGRNKAAPSVPATAAAKPASAPEKVAAAPAAAPPQVESAHSEWARSLEILESERGKLTLSKPIALLLGPFSDEQLLRLVEMERRLKEKPYHSAFVLGITSSGHLVARRSAETRSPEIAQETAIDRCKKNAQGPCLTVMVNDELREAAFLGWARRVQGSGIVRLRKGFLGLGVAQP